MEFKKKLLLAFALLLCFFQLQANDFRMATDDDYEVVDGVLVAYHGAGGDVIIPDNLGITEIGANVFYENTSIATIIIPVGVTKIGFSAFFSCTNMTSISLSNTVDTISDFAFARCSGLTSIAIPKSVEFISDWAFENCTWLSDIIVDANNTKYADINGVLYDKNITVLYRYPEGKTGNSFTISNGVEVIGFAAFLNCKNLTSITIANTVEAIAPSAFKACSALTSITIPASATTIVSFNIFDDCLQLSAIDVESGNNVFSSTDGVVYNKSQTTLYRFPEGKNTASFTIPGTVEVISKGAFYQCLNLLSITIPGSVETIGEEAFWKCSGFTSISLPNSVTRIGYRAFGECIGLTSVTLSNSVEIIESFAFASCEKITSIALPQSLLTLGEYAFAGCPELTAINVDANNPNYSSDEGVLYDKNQTVLIYYPPKRNATVFGVPNTVTTISGAAFSGCGQLVSVIIPNSVETIGIEAFFYCNKLRSMELPSSVTNIGSGAFAYNSFDDITVYWTEPLAISTVPFHFWEGRSYNLYVPIGTSDAYKAVDYWKNNDFIITEQEPVTGISLDISSMNVPVNYKVQLIPTVSPRNASSKNVTWSSSNPAVATVTAYGLVTAKSEGIATITATTEVGGFKTECMVAVENGDFVVVNGVLTAYRGAGGIVNIPGSLGITEIGASVFEGNNTLSSVTIPEGVTKIAEKAFYNSSLTDVSIPASTLTISNNAFGNCHSLLAINVDTYNPNYSSVNGVLYNIYKTVILVYPKAKVGPFVTMPGTILYITERVFADCIGLTAIVIPNTVISMGESAFNGCSQLTDMTVHWPAPLPVSENVFDGFDRASCTLHVLNDNEVKNRYETFPVWEDFMSIIADVQSVSVTNVRLNKQKFPMYLGDTEQLFATVDPENATNKIVSWVSSNTAVATVSTSGLITALSHGTTTIIVKTDDLALEASCEVTVREPETLVWIGEAGTDWDDLANWQDGQIPARKDTIKISNNVKNFPILTESVTVSKVHFAPGAQMGRQSLLNGKAFVQYDFSKQNSRNRWHMLSMPLGQAYPGDFTFGGYPLTWVRTFTEGESTDNDGGVTKGSWVPASGGKTGAFTHGDGFVLWLDEDDTRVDKGLHLLNGIHELPFFHHQASGSPKKEEYDKVHYTHKYDGETQSEFYNFKFNDKIEEYERIEDDFYPVSRSEDAFRLTGVRVFKELNTESSNGSKGSFTLIGNPYMACLDFGNLYDTNIGIINPSYHVWTGEGYETYAFPFGSAGIMKDNPLSRLIAPLQGFIVEKPATASTNSLRIEEWMATVDNGVVLRSTTSNEDRLDIVAGNSVAKVRTFIAKREGGQDEFCDLDARKIMNGISDVPEIYTLKPYKNGLIATSVNIINNDELLIPVGLATSYEGNITLSFTGMDSYDAKLSLIDTQINTPEIDLTGKVSYEHIFNYIPKKVNGEPAVCEDRFFIRISKTTTGLMETITEKVNVFEANGLIRIISGTSNPIKEVAVYNLQGGLMYKATAINTIAHTVNRNWPAGVYIVKVVSEKNTDNVKMLIHF